MAGRGTRTAKLTVEQPIDLGSSDGEHTESQKRAKKDALVTLYEGPICPDIYTKSCKCKKDNPNCLTGIIPTPTGFRKKGLWQKDTRALLAQGLDPAAEERKDAATPSGLNNLGNTCYVNGALQCLYMTPAFRQGLYAVEPPVAEDEVIGYIRQLFAAMQASAKASADPTAFAASLKLDNSVQQDGQEFFKLLLSHLEAKLQRSSSRELKELVPKLFRGSYAYETTCQVCNQLSEGSRRETYFYELDVQVKGYNSLEKSLEEMQHVELLSGANQYFCSICAAKADATRQLLIKTLPPYLCLSLQRFVFDLKKLAKVKASNKISFPLTLDMGQVMVSMREKLGGSPDGPLEYELAAILIHKGPSATHGHYVAHIKEEGSEKWWRCDDESVTGMPNGPIDSCADLGVAPEKKSTTAEKRGAGEGKGTQRHQKRQKRTSKAASPSPDPDSRASSPAAFAASSGRIVSSNAYMLLYRKKGAAPISPSKSSNDIPLPQSLASAVGAANEEYKASCAAYKRDSAAYSSQEAKEEQKEELLRQMKERQKRIRTIMENAALNSNEEDFRFVSASWLRKWADSTEACPVDNSDLLCSHGRLHPDKQKDAKKIRTNAWDSIQSGDRGGGPELRSDDICQECISQRLKSAHQQTAQTEQRDSVLAQLQDDELNPASCGDGFYVSKSWLAGWKKRAKRDSSLALPTAGITCPHGGLMPDVAGGKAKRIPISSGVWEYIQSSWKQSQEEARAQQQQKAQEAADAKAAQRSGEDADSNEVILVEEGFEPVPAELLQQNPAAEAAKPKTQDQANGHTDLPQPKEADEDIAVEIDEGVSVREFPVATTSECQTCLADLKAGAAAGKDMKQILDQERQAFPSLHAGVAPNLEPSIRYSLLPRAWMLLWRAHVSSGHKRDPERQQPPPLSDALGALFCSCHRETQPLLDQPPPKVTKKRGRWTAEPSDIYEVAPLEDAQRLINYYAAENSGDKGISLGSQLPSRMVTATMEVFTSTKDCATDSAKESDHSHQPPSKTGTPDATDAMDLTAEGLEPEVERAEQPGWWVVNGDQKARQPKEPAGQSCAELVTTPEVCQQAIADRKNRMLATALDYQNVEIMVELVSKGTLHDAPSDRKSKRSRRGRSALSVSCGDTLKELRMNIAQSLGIHPLNAQIHAMQNGAWQPLVGEDLTLKDLLVLPDSDLRVINLEKHDDSDLASFVETPREGGQAREHGFAGTVLTGQALLRD